MDLPALEYSSGISVGGTGKTGMSGIFIVPNLKTITWTYGYASSAGIVEGEDNLVELHFPELQFYTKVDFFWITFAKNCKNLEVLYVPKLTKFFYTYTILSCPKCRKIVYGSCDSAYSVYGYGDFVGSECLTHMEFGHDTTIEPHLVNWNPTEALLTTSTNLIEDKDICSNNLEQFLYNFREYILKRLKNIYTNKIYVYLHQNVKQYILGEDDEAYAASWTVPGENVTYYVSIQNILIDKNIGIAS